MTALVIAAYLLVAVAVGSLVFADKVASGAPYSMEDTIAPAFAGLCWPVFVPFAALCLAIFFAGYFFDLIAERWNR